MILIIYCIMTKDIKALADRQVWVTTVLMSTFRITLLREIGTNFETPALDDLVTGSSTAVLFGAPLLIITGTISSSNGLVFWGSFVALALFFILFVFLLLKKEKIKV